MRRRRSSRPRGAGALLVVAPAALLALAAPAARGQGGGAPAVEGGLFVLLPIGAQTAGQGEAIAAAQTGSEAVWWNPAGLARAERREIAVHHAQTIFATGDAVTVLIPSHLLGVAALSIHILDFGDLERTIGPGDPIGEIVPRGMVYAATYGTAFADRLAAGVTYKVLQFRVDCRGECGELPPSASTSALDAGLQLELAPAVPVTLGIVVRNMGLDFQVNDEEQADPLPTRVQFGARWKVTALAGVAPRVDVQLAGDVVNRMGSSPQPSARLGATAIVDRIVHLRGGYSFEDSEHAGPSVGIGVALRNVRVDLARIIESFSSQAGKAPTFISLRYLF